MQLSLRRIMPILLFSAMTIIGILAATPGHAAPRVLEAKAFEVKTGEWYYDPKDIMVETSDMVTITLQHVGSASIPHDIVFELESGRKAASKRIRGGETDILGFAAPAEPGEYVFYCSVGNHRSRGMEGKLIVTGPGGTMPSPGSTAAVTTTARPEPSATRLPPTSVPVPSKWWNYLPLVIKGQTLVQR